MGENAAMTKILVAEDERIVALNLQRRLLKLGYEVPAIASTGEDAVRKALEIQPDLVLMDIHFEGEMDGIEAAAQIRAARAVHPFGYLLKPFFERDLHATIQMALEHHKAEMVLAESGERLRLALDSAGMAIWEWVPVTGEFRANGHMDAVVGYASGAFSGKIEDFLAGVHEEDRAAVQASLQRALAEGAPYEIEFRQLRPDGGIGWTRALGKTFPAAGDKGLRVIGVAQDITERRLAEDRLRQASTVFHSTQEGIIITDADRQVISVNQAFSAMTGFAPEEAVGREPHMLSGETLEPEQCRTLWATLEREGRWQGEIKCRRKTGESFYAWISVTAVRDSAGKLNNYVLLFSDIGALRQAEERLNHLAHHDSLTDLPNRILALDRLDHILAQARRRNRRAALLFVDLDRFKRINDTLGHSVGDELLRTTAERLRACVRAADTVARLGGDEFLVIPDQVESTDELAHLARKLIATLSVPVTLAGREIEVSGSIGISLFPDDAGSKDALIRAADAAMYAAKEKGRNRYVFYSREMTARAERYLSLDQDLRRGFARGELELHYQPQVSLADGRITGVEAIIRWRHPEKGLLGAAEFVPLAEENGLIIDIGAWVLRQACIQARDWRASGLPPLRLAVNVAERQIRSDHLPATVDQALLHGGMDPRWLELEITESALQHEDSSVPVLLELKKRGIRIAIDDFGTGYSSLRVLKHLPLDRLKIDQAFIRNIARDPDDEAIAATILAMGSHLRLKVTAEGVETREQAEFLRAHGCQEAQGFLFGPPAPPEAIPELLKRAAFEV
jgi:diguanylate cyclase (GGDEF)-like protein/PAS domain S-box-containing protein